MAPAKTLVICAASLAAIALAFPACRKAPGKHAPANPPTSDPAPAELSEPAGPPAIVPGLAQKRLIAPLEDAYERVDPTKDGWESEAFNNAAMEQLHAIEALLVSPGPIAPEQLAPIVAKSIRATPLRPENAAKVFDDGRLRVMRASSSGDPVAGFDALAASLNAIKRMAPTIDPHLKIFRISREGESTVSTSVIVEIAARSTGERRQINGVWSCNWLTADDSAPALASISVTQFEEVIQRGDAPLFSDVTAAALEKNPSYHDQLLVPTDHWRSRIPRDLGLDPVANHGLAIGDVNGDELDDVYLCQQGGLPNRLFIQNADGTFRDATPESGAGWLDYCAAALFVDFDNDGDRDLAISQDFRVLVMSNDGSGRFTLEFGSSTKAQSFSLAAADYDNDGLVDFYICGYNPSNAAVRSGAMGEPMPFHDANNGGQNILWRNDGNFSFTDVTAATGMEQNNTRYSFAAAWEDYDNDGDQDLYVANDYGRNCLYRNDGGKFSDVAAALGIEDTSSGMSVSWSDFDHNGSMDLYVSNMFSTAGNRITFQRQFKPDIPAAVRAEYQHMALGNTLFQASPGGTFTDVSIQAGVTVGRWAWSSKFVDFNNDGFDDILVANGFITTADTGDL
jgi:FG-GAP-like repeat